MLLRTNNSSVSNPFQQIVIASAAKQSPETLRSIKYFSLFTVWFFIILYLSFSPLNGWPQETFFQKIYADKIVHVTMYLLLSTFLLFAFYRQKHNQKLSLQLIFISIICCASIGIAIEILQPILTSYRQFEWLDMVANACGALLSYWVYLWMVRKNWMVIGKLIR